MTRILHPPTTTGAYSLAVLLLASAMGFVAQIQVLPFLPLLAIVGFFFSQVPLFRFGVFFVGSLVVFGGAESVDILGVGYALMFGAYSLIALTSAPILKGRNSAFAESVKLLIIASVLFGTYVLLTLGPALVNGTPALGWLRDALPLLLIASSPVIALDLASSLSLQAYERLLVVCGLGSALFVAIEWTSRRGFSLIPVERLLFGSVWPVVALSSYGLFQFQFRGRGYQWLIFPGLGMSLLMLSGSRGLIVLIAGILIGLLLNHLATNARSMPGLGVRVTKIIVLLPTVILLGLFLVSRLGIMDSSALGSRYVLLSNVTNYGTEDLSYAGRLNQTKEALRVFRESPLFGTGPGTRYSVEFKYQTYTFVSESMDSPAGFLAEHGLVGLAILSVFLYLVLRSFRRLPRIDANSSNWPVLAIFLTATAFFLPLTDLSSDRGFALGLILAMLPPLLGTQLPNKDHRNSA